MTNSRFEVTKSATFEAAHYLTHGPAESRYRRLHGHSFRVEATVGGAVLGHEGWSPTWPSLKPRCTRSPASLTMGC